MTRARLLGTVISLAVAPLGVDGQLSEGAHFELGAAALYSRFDPGRLPLADDFGVGMRAGWFFTRSLSVEATASRTLTRSPALAQGVEVSEFGTTVLTSVSAGGYNRIFVGLGYSRLTYIGAVDFTDHAAHAVLGDRVPLTRKSALRLEARAIYAPSSNAPPGAGGRAITMSFSVGVSLFLRSRPPRDSDGDLVPDRSDQCALTPVAAAVDGRGCPRDGDSDGVFDGLDRCMLTPADATVGVDGCALDGDGDGVPDYRDLCAGTVPGVTVDDGGCVPDTDGDGVADDLDRCSATPPSAAVDAAGCALDSDADGIPDHLDRCEGTPPELPVDGLGCQLLFEEEEEGERTPLVLRGVNFELNRAILTPDSYEVLDQVAASLVANPDVRVEVAGHADVTGAPELNRPLSLARAETVRDYLVSQGVAPDRLVPRGYGADQPVADNDTEEGRAQNRRVELRLIES